MADLIHANGVPKNMMGSFARMMCKGRPLDLEADPHQLDIDRPQYISTQTIKGELGSDVDNKGKGGR